MRSFLVVTISFHFQYSLFLVGDKSLPCFWHCIARPWGDPEGSIPTSVLLDHIMFFTLLVTILFAITYPHIASNVHLVDAFTSHRQISKFATRTKSWQVFLSKEPLTSQCSVFFRCNETSNGSNVDEKSPPLLRHPWNAAVMLSSTMRLKLSRRVWTILRFFTTHLRHHWKKHSSPVAWRQLDEARKFLRSTLCNFLVAFMIYWNFFFGVLPAAPTESSFESPVSVLTKVRTRFPTLDAESTLSKSRDLVSGRSIEVEKEREVIWQQRQHKEFRWDICPEDDYLGLGYPNSPRFIVSQISDHSKATSPLEQVKFSTNNVA